MSHAVPMAVEAGARLRRIESLLDQAIDDLTGKGRSSPGSRCAAALTEASAELRSFAALLTESRRERHKFGRLEAEERAALLPRVKALLPRLSRAERLLAAAAQFYEGWCAAGSAAGQAQNYSSPGYQIESWPHSENWPHSPVLLAFEG